MPIRRVLAVGLMAAAMGWGLAAAAGPAENLLGAARAGDTTDVEALLARGVDANAKDRSATTALMAAAYGDYIETVRTLIAKGADVNAKDAKGATALMGAAFGDYIDVVDALIAKGADVNARDAKGATALIAATQYGHADVPRSAGRRRRQTLITRTPAISTRWAEARSRRLAPGSRRPPRSDRPRTARRR